MSGQSISFTVPIEPRGWARARKNGNRFFKDENTRVFENAIAAYGRAAMKGRAAFDGPLAIIVSAMMPLPPSWSKKKREAALRNEIYPTGRPDADNILKGVADALNGVAYRDDAQIVTALSIKTYATVPAIEVRINPMNKLSRPGGTDGASLRGSAEAG